MSHYLIMKGEKKVIKEKNSIKIWAYIAVLGIPIFLFLYYYIGILLVNYILNLLGLEEVVLPSEAVISEVIGIIVGIILSILTLQFDGILDSLLTTIVIGLMTAYVLKCFSFYVSNFLTFVSKSEILMLFISSIILSLIQILEFC